MGISGTPEEMEVLRRFVDAVERIATALGVIAGVQKANLYMESQAKTDKEPS